MVRLDGLIFGYRIITAEEGFSHRLATHLLLMDIPAEEQGSGFAIRERDYKRFSEYAKGRIRYTVTDLMGLPALLLRARSFVPVLITALICFIITILLSGIVWDVRIVTDDVIEDDRVVDALREIGFGEGSSWYSFDKEHTEAELLSRLEELAWVSINREGTVALVELRLKEGDKRKDSEDIAVSNIVAAEDGVIEEIIVESGRAMVAKGDVVRKGDILISGVIETEYGTLLTAARGRVVAHRLEELSLEVAREESRTEYETARVGAASVSIFGFNINIFKNYGNLEGEYAIIEEKQRATLWDGTRLPIALSLSYIGIPYEEISVYTDAELPIIAEERLLDELDVLRSDGDLIKLSTDGEYTDVGYRLNMSAVIAIDIGMEKPVILE